MESLVDKFLKECVCAGQCSTGGISSFAPEHVISLENKNTEDEGEKLVEAFLETIAYSQRT